MKTYRITSRFRFTLFVVTCIVVLTTIINFGLGFNTAHSQTVENTESVYVMSGDTLWDIAGSYLPEMDRNKAVYKICQINDIKASDLKAGMEILVPVN